MTRSLDAIQIDKGIPLSKTYGKRKYPFAEMDVGDSFRVSLGSVPRDRVRLRLLTAAREHRPLKFATRTDGDGIRIWRIA